MNTHQDLRFDSAGHSRSSSHQGSYDAGSYISKFIGKTGSYKMPIYDKRANEGVLRSSLPSPTDLSHHNENYNGN